MDKITIRAFRATNDPERCRTFASEHIKVLSDIGVASIIKPDLSWTTDPGTIVFVAEHDELGMIAGIRLEIAGPVTPLRMQTCLEPMSTDVVPLLKELQPHGNAELCGLWNAHRFAGQGVPMLLIESAMAAANQLGLRTIVTFIAEYVAPYAKRSGFVPINSIGENGILVYPIPTIKTWAMVLPDVLTLCNAEKDVRKRMISLRMRPRQQRIESPKKNELLVSYELVLDQAMAANFELVVEHRKRFAA